MIPSRENNSKIAIKIFIHSYYGGQPGEYRCCLVCVDKKKEPYMIRCAIPSGIYLEEVDSSAVELKPPLRTNAAKIRLQITTETISEMGSAQ